MLQGPELLALTVKDVQLPDGKIRSVIKVARTRRKPPVRCVLSEKTAKALGKWIAESGAKGTDYIFPGKDDGRRRPMSGRQMHRLLKSWVTEAGLDPKKYGTEIFTTGEGSPHLEQYRRSGDGSDALGAREDQVYGALFKHRQKDKIRPHRG